MGDLYRDEDFDSLRNPTEWDYFEAMDRTSVIMTMFEHSIYNHVGLDTNEAELAREISDKLFQLYQSLGAKALSAK